MEVIVDMTMDKYKQFPLRVNRTSAYTSSVPHFKITLSITTDHTENRDPEREDFAR
jgi:hypothetical protein